jgi:hypothetical protein
VWAQGFGPDPFKPYNSEYEAYTFPTGPGGADAAAGAAAARSGLRGANQYQDYLNELYGYGRQSVEKYGIGLPYYRAAISPGFNKERREYRPNSKSETAFEETQQLITQKYLAYFAERDPKKRALLKRDFNQTRRNVTRALSLSRGGNAAQLLEEAAGLDTRGHTRGSAARRADDLKAGAGSTRGLTEDGGIGAPPPIRGRASGSSASRSGLIPPAPPISTRAERAARARSEVVPSDVLDRASRLNDLHPRPARVPAIDPQSKPDETAPKD